MLKWVYGKQKNILKILILGDVGVGKTSIAKRYAFSSFLEPDVVTSTIGVDFFTKEITYDSQRYSIAFWDFGGAKRFRQFIPDLFKGAHGGILVFDPTSKASLSDLEDFWIPSLEEKLNITFSSNKKFPFILLRNKTDIEYLFGVEVTHDEVEDVVQKYGLEFIETSAKEGKNLDKALYTLLKKVQEYNLKKK